MKTRKRFKDTTCTTTSDFIIYKSTIFLSIVGVSLDNGIVRIVRYVVSVSNKGGKFMYWKIRIKNYYQRKEMYISAL